MPLALAAGAVSAAGTLVGGVQSMMNANSEADVARENAALSREAARDSIDRGRDEATVFYRSVGRLKGQQIAAMAANGIDVGYGSALREQQDTAALSQEDATRLYKNIGERTRGFDINARNFVMEAKAAKARGKQAMISSLFEAGSTMMSAASQQKMLRAKMGVTRGDVNKMIRRNPGTF